MKDGKVGIEYRCLCGMIGAGNVAMEEREEHDFYATPPIAAKWLMRIERLNHHIWECACGMGHLSEEFTRGGVRSPFHGSH